MKQNYSYFIVILLVFGMFMPAKGLTYTVVFHARVDTLKTGKSKITDTRSNKPAYLKNGVRVNFVPFKPAVDKFFGNVSGFPRTYILPAEDKVLTNVKVYPNPVSDQLNLSYRVSKDSNVTIKIMDVLGNEIATLLSERLPAGEQTNSFNIASRLNSGFYFIRLIAGNETVIKRISVL